MNKKLKNHGNIFSLSKKIVTHEEIKNNVDQKKKENMEMKRLLTISNNLLLLIYH